MELDIQKKFIRAPCAQLYSLAEAPQTPPPPFGLILEGAIGQPKLTTSLCDTSADSNSKE